MESTHTVPPPAGAQPLGATLRRSSSDRLLLGLCSGIARSTGAGTTTVRIATVVLGVVFLPATVLAYLVTAALLPRDDGAVLVGPGTRDRRDVTTALVLTFVGAPLVIGAGAAWGLTSGPLLLPLLLLGAGAALGVAVYRPDAAKPALWTAPASAASAYGAATDPAAGVTTHAAAPATTDAEAERTGDAAEAPTTVGAPAGAISPAGEDPTAVHPGQPGPPTGPPLPPGGGGPTFVKPGGLPPSAPEPPEDKRRGLALPVICAMAVIPAIFAVLFAVGVIDGGWTTWAIMLAVLALVAAGGAVAIALLRPSYLGAALLVILAAVLGTTSIALSQVGPVLDEGVGERTYRPQGTADLDPLYEHGVGVLNLDLRDLELRRGSRTPVRAEIGFGEVNVAVPRGVRVVAAPDSSLTGVVTSARRNGASEADSASAPTIVLDISARAADVRLLSGTSPNIDDLEVLAQEDTGFWEPDGGSDRFDRYRDLEGAATP